MKGGAVLLLVKGGVAVEGIVYTDKLFVHPKRNFSEKKLVAVADSAAAEAKKDLHFVHSAVNQS